MEKLWGRSDQSWENHRLERGFVARTGGVEEGKRLLWDIFRMSAGGGVWRGPVGRICPLQTAQKGPSNGHNPSMINIINVEFCSYLLVVLETGPGNLFQPPLLPIVPHFP